MSAGGLAAVIVVVKQGSVIVARNGLDTAVILGYSCNVPISLRLCVPRSAALLVVKVSVTALVVGSTADVT